MNPPTNSAASPPMAGSAIPEHVATCPECGGKLYFNADYDTDPESDEPPGIECENEPDLDDAEEDFHRSRQSDWQPVIDKIKVHFRGQNESAMGREDESAHDNFFTPE